MSDSRKCECGFEFSGPREYRNCEVYRDKHGQWWNVCPNCGKQYKSRE